MSADGVTAGAGFLSASARFTIRRVRGVIIASLNGTLAGSDHVRIGIGLAVFSTDSVVAGGASLPEPLGDPAFPWMWWREISLRMPGSSTNATWVNPGGWGLAAQQIEVDVKAMRIIRPDQSLAWVIQYSNTSGNPPVALDFGIHRVLEGLH